jgi:cell division septation protein DedD
MSMRDDGHGLGTGPAPEAQANFAGRQSAGYAEDGQSWGPNAPGTQISEVTSMVQGADRPGPMGQRSIFGGSSPMFAQMPSYTPVTRGGSAPDAPSFDPYVAASQPAPQPSAPAPSSPSLQTSSYSSYVPSYQATDYQPQAFGGASAPSPQSSYASPEPARPQSYSGYDPAQDFRSQNYQGYPSTGYAQPSFPDTNFSAPNYAETSFPSTSFAGTNAATPSFTPTNFGGQSFAPAGNGQQGFAPAGNAQQSFADANFGEQNFDAGYPEPSYPADASFDEGEPASQEAAPGYRDAQSERGFETYQEEAAQDYVMASQTGAAGNGQVPQSDPRRQLQAFDALYDQPPSIALGSTEPRRPAQDFYEGERVDADFLDESQIAPPAGTHSKLAKTFKGRSAFMVGSALLGAIALGGALAFAYKQSGGGIGEVPVVQADARPVKEVPDDAGGKDFPHNKLIYDRLASDGDTESDQIVPHQEDVAVPALPPASETAGLPTPVATTDSVTPPSMETAANQTTGDSTDADGGPRKVKTMVVKPDGSVMPPPLDAAAPDATASTADGSAPDALSPPAPLAAPSASATPSLASPPAAETPTTPPQQVAAVEPKAPPKPEVKTAAATPQAATGPAKYVVQVGAKKSQTDALASFADIQQKYPTLLANYRPIVQKANLGSKGTWYRLRIGPINDKTAAYKLCSQLKSQGLPDCLVMTE